MPDLRDPSKAFCAGNCRAEPRFRPCFYPHDYAMSQNPDNAATLFKRLTGTGTPVKLPAVNLSLTPEECSAEILRVLFGYLAEEIRNDSNTGTAITVPAAFNQMQKDSTMSAADAAGIGQMALMQEPVAASPGDPDITC